MYTHRAKIQLKPNSYIELSQQIKDKIMPALRLQKGFCDGVTSIDTFWMTAIEDTRWETREDAEAYQRTGYSETLKTLSEVIDAEPVTSIFEASGDGFNQSGKTF
ncbi:MAG TPA: hypothetical protein VIL74_02290 [Pyrinomonadaceae bacterium]|jgi:hypothetical protein